MAEPMDRRRLAPAGLDVDVIAAAVLPVRLDVDRTLVRAADPVAGDPHPLVAVPEPVAVDPDVMLRGALGDHLDARRRRGGMDDDLALRMRILDDDHLALGRWR